jgi:hypothetical protein
MDENANLSPLAVRPKIDKVKTVSGILDKAAAGDNMVNKLSHIFFETNLLFN